MPKALQRYAHLQVCVDLRHSIPKRCAERYNQNQSLRPEISSYSLSSHLQQITHQHIFLPADCQHATSLQAQLALVRQSAEPLRKLLDIEIHDWARHQRQAAAAALLPVPLFIIFHQLTAAASVFEERLEITIAGAHSTPHPPTPPFSASPPTSRSFLPILI